MTGARLSRAPFLYTARCSRSYNNRPGRSPDTGENMLRASLFWVCALGAMALPAQTFDAPKMLKTGDTPIGNTLNKRERIYPSPALYDIDADGVKDLVIGDLFGNLTWCKGGKESFGEEKILNAADGQPLKFHNW